MLAEAGRHCPRYAAFWVHWCTRAGVGWVVPENTGVPSFQLQENWSPSTSLLIVDCNVLSRPYVGPTRQVRECSTLRPKEWFDCEAWVKGALSSLATAEDT